MKDIVDTVIRQFGKLADNFNDYNFYVKNQPSKFDSSSTICLNTYASRDELATVPCIYKWSRSRNGVSTEAPEYRGNSFICQPSDVGALIIVQVTSTDPAYSGTALLKFGPVKFDAMLKQQIQVALVSRERIFGVDLQQGGVIKQCDITIEEGRIIIKDCHSNTSFNFIYTLAEPQVEVFPNDPTRLKILFGEKYAEQLEQFNRDLFGRPEMAQSQTGLQNRRFEIRFPQRRLRDIFIFIMKGFNTKREIKSSAVISQIEKMDFSEKNFDMVLEMQSLRADLLAMHQVNSRLQFEKKLYFQECQKLQQEISEIIMSYTKIVENKFKDRADMEKSFLSLQLKKEEIMNPKITDLQRENFELREKVAVLVDQLNAIEPNGLKEYHGLTGFSKKQNPYQALEIEPILSQLDESNIAQEALSRRSKQLQQELYNSKIKIEKLENEVFKYEKEIQLHSLNVSQDKKEHSRHNLTAIQISTQYLLNQKDQLKKNYMKVIDENRKLKERCQKSEKSQKAKSNVGNEKTARKNPLYCDLDPEAKIDPESKQKIVSESQLKDDQGQRKQLSLKEQNLQLLRKMQNQRAQHQASCEKYKKQIKQMKEQIQMLSKNNELINRSQNLSYDMDEYMNEQMEALKKENKLLAQQNQKLILKCQKYAAKIEKYRATLQENSILSQSSQQL